MRSVVFLVAVIVGSSFAADVRADELTDALTTLKQATPNTASQTAAQQAWKTASAVAPARLPELLAALDDAGPLAANWIRAAVDAVGERAVAGSDKSVAPILEKFTLETHHSPRARRLSYDWLVRLEPTAADRLMPGFLDDPSTELRRDAVERLVAEATKNTDAAAKKRTLERAFAAARDIDQIRELADKLKKLDVQVDLPTHYGFITKWQLIGPFDNVGGKGFNTVFPPETEINLTAKYPGKGDQEVAWKEHTTTEPHGKVDFNAALGKNKGAAAYAYTEFVSDRERPVDVRIGSIVAVKLWVNGKLLDSRETYHSGTEIDQYVSHTTLQPGVNRILVKVCENEQTESWAQDWEFQLRICDAVGTAVLSQDRVATK
jgi:hypothetical protein